MAEPLFQCMTVVRREALTPRLNRVVLRGDAARLATGGLHVRVLLPPADTPPRWPTPDPATGALVWHDGPDAPIGRLYTLRHVDVARDEVAIDVVWHGDSPGSRWGATARPGDVVGIAGPGGGGTPAARWHLFAGDETAAPAIARMLEELPPDIPAVVRLELDDEADIPPLVRRPSLDIQLLPRRGREPVGRLLEAAVAAVPLPADRADAHLWVGCERAAARRIRRALEARLGATPCPRCIAAYWTAGRADTAARED